MGIRFACHHCGKRLNIKRELAGKRGICPACATRFRIPLSDAEISAPAEQNSQPRLQKQNEPVATSSPRSIGKLSEPTVGQGVVNTEVALSGHEPEATWYVRPPSGGQYGPASTELLGQWIQEGRVAALSLLWREGWPQWRTATEALPELAGQLPGGDLTSPGGSLSSEGVAAGISAANAPVSGDPAVAGQADLGAQRRVRSSHRVFWIATLSVLAIVLLGVLVVIVGR